MMFAISSHPVNLAPPSSPPEATIGGAVAWWRGGADVAGVMARADRTDCAGGCSGYAVGYQMTNYNKKPSMRRMGVAKTRLCLKCREPFKSGWSGERVCKRCKSDSSWRDGSDFEAELRVMSKVK